MGTHNGARRGRKKVDGCAVALVLGASLFAGLAVVAGEFAKWLV